MLLTIYVGRRKQDLITADGMKARVHPLLVNMNGEFRQLQECEDFKEVEDVEIIAARKFFGCRPRRLSLTLEVRKGIVNFLRHYRNPRDLSFNCYSFVSLVHNIDWTGGFSLWPRFWSLEPLRRLRPGDVVFLVDFKKQWFHHAAIYVGLGFYLSVWGGGGDLEVATLRDMKSGYKAKDVVQVVPRRD